MEEKSGISSSGVITVKGDEALASRTEFQQNPSFLQSVGPTTVVSPSPPPPPTTVIPGSTAAAPPSITSAGSDLTKKKRGRPRKYAPDGSLNPRALRPTLSPTPISSSIPFSGDYNHHSNWKRGEAQQQQHVDFIKKSHESSQAPPSPGLSCYVGVNFTTHQFTVNAGEDVTMKVMPYSQGSRAICILSATGSISNVTLRQFTTSGGTLTYEVNLMNMESNFSIFLVLDCFFTVLETIYSFFSWLRDRFEILSLSGSFMPTEDRGTKGRSGGMSISLAGPNGKIIGGGLAGMLIAASPVQVIMGSFIVMHQAEQTQKNKPRFMDASPPPQQQQHPTFSITTVNSTSPVVATVEEPNQQTYGGGIMRPLAQMPYENSAMNNFTTTYHGDQNMHNGTKKEDDYDDGGDDNDSCDTRSLSNGDELFLDFLV
ncbi:unnamed protein product [Eruca vesicaria subsp. sativa]|uniref:AT-hook motif nuclear-localized protein n=1 Tax=Eruca vesicaria subsp. sativa TaxID=29727 RepID=A0ABC8M6V6_ERUVS|nr:unnamed protein product [Eruca vesicaria subsp. sativa]